MEISAKIRNLIQNKIRAVLQNKEKAIFGVVGGTSIKNVLIELAKQEIPWEKVHFYMIDERFVDLESKDSNYRQLKENLLDSIKISKENLHPFDYSLENPVEEYNKEFFKQATFFDIILLGSGEEGHIASLFPNHDSIRNNSEYFIKVNDSPKLPAERISASKKLIEKSKTAILLFSKGKEQAYENFLDINLGIEQCPAKLVNSIEDRHVFTDF